MQKIKVKLDEPFQIIVVDDSGNECFYDEYSFDPATLVTWERGGRAELMILSNEQLLKNRGLKKVKHLK